MKKMISFLLVVFFITTGFSSSVLLQESIYWEDIDWDDENIDWENFDWDSVDWGEEEEEKDLTWGEYYLEELNNLCKQIDGRFVCLDTSFQFNVPVKFLENIECYSDVMTTDPEMIQTCYSTVSLTKPEIFELKYVTENTDPESVSLTEHFYKNKTYAVDEYFVTFNRNSFNNIDFSKCSASYLGENEIYSYNSEDDEFYPEHMDLYSYECPYEGKIMISDLVILPGEDGFMIMSIKNPSLFSGAIVYIIIIAIILAVVYYISKKKNGTRRIRRKRI